MSVSITRTHLILAGTLVALAAAFWMWSDTRPERSEAANEQEKTEIHFEIDGTSGTGPAHCDSRTQTICKLNTDSAFTVNIIPSAIPIGGYTAFQTQLEYGNLLYKPLPEVEDEITFAPLEPTGFEKRAPAQPTGKEGLIGHGAVVGTIPDGNGLFPVTFQKTSLLHLAFNCAENGQTPGQSHSNLMRFVSFDESPAGTLYADAVTSTIVPNLSDLTVECNPPPPPEMRTTGDIAAYGEDVRCGVRAWWQARDDKRCAERVATYYGKQPLHEVLERTTWHPCQHVRQVMSLLQRLGIPPDRPLTAADLARLPLPQEVWDE